MINKKKLIFSHFIPALKFRQLHKNNIIEWHHKSNALVSKTVGPSDCDPNNLIFANNFVHRFFAASRNYENNVQESPNAMHNNVLLRSIFVIKFTL